jgi:hypothetical protein
MDARHRGLFRDTYFLFYLAIRYIGEVEDDMVIILCGGDKDSQDKDIARAKKYWKADFCLLHKY